jgi:hypothetical protein
MRQAAAAGGKEMTNESCAHPVIAHDLTETVSRDWVSVRASEVARVFAADAAARADEVIE